MTRAHPSHAIHLAFLMTMLGACGNAEPGEGTTPQRIPATEVEAIVSRGGGIDPAMYAGDLKLKIVSDIPTDVGGVPVTLYAGLDAVSETRLRVNAFADLRAVQGRLDEILSGVLDETCTREFRLDVVGAEAEGDRIRVSGSVRAEFFTCRDRGSEAERRGFRLLSQTVDSSAVATASFQDQCIEFTLLELEVSPRGFLGGMANIFGLTERVRQTVLKKGNEFLAENRICPSLPPELAALSPDFISGGPREIGDGGAGVGFSGSVDTSASTIVSLLSVVKESGIVEGQR